MKSRRLMIRAKFTDYAFSKSFEKQRKTIKCRGTKQITAIKDKKNVETTEDKKRVFKGLKQGKMFDELSKERMGTIRELSEQFISIIYLIISRANMLLVLKVL